MSGNVMNRLNDTRGLGVPRAVENERCATRFFVFSINWPSRFARYLFDRLPERPQENTRARR